MTRANEVTAGAVQKALATIASVGITEEAGLGMGWVPREMRHTFVSLLSARGVPVEAIALLAGTTRR